MNISIIKFGQQLRGGEYHPHKHTFGAFCGAMCKDLTRYTDFVSTSTRTKVYRQREFDTIRRSFESIYEFEMMGGFGVYSYFNGLYFLEMWTNTSRDFILEKFQCIGVDDFLHFVDARHQFDSRCIVDKVQQHFDSID